MPASPPAPPPVPIPDPEIPALRAKVRVLEAHRADDARQIQELTNRLAAASQFVETKPRLIALINSQKTELSELKRELSDKEQYITTLDTRAGDGQELLEMAMLDKEVAEERAELAEAELEELRERLAIAEVELEVLKEGEEEEPKPEGEDDPGKSSLAYLQLEKQNERLKEALIRLRDMSAETDHDQRRRMAEMEKDLSGYDELQSAFIAILLGYQLIECFRSIGIGIGATRKCGGPGRGTERTTRRRYGRGRDARTTH